MKNMNKTLQRQIKIVLMVIFLLIIISILVFDANKNNFKTEKVAKTHTIHRMFENEMITEEVINEDNSQYDFIQSGNIILMEYGGNEDCVVVPKKLEGKNITQINSKAFVHSDNLEIIKIPAEISDNIDVIDEFEISEDLSNDEYIVYVTTKEYTESYLEYINLSNEQRRKTEVVPFKFVISENENSRKTREIATTYTSIPSSFDLRKDKGIKIIADNQGDLGLCYAYSSIKSAETNVALTKGKERDFSEIHLAVKSKQFYGGSLSGTRRKYWYKGYGPVTKKTDTLLDQSNIEDLYIRATNSIANNIYLACKGTKTLTTKEIDDAIKGIDNLKPIQEFYVVQIDQFQISGSDKLDSSKESKVSQTRNEMKNHIQKYGSLSVCISDPSNSEVCCKDGKYMVMNAKKRIWD